MGNFAIRGTAAQRGADKVLLDIARAAAARSAYDVTVFSGKRHGTKGSRHDKNKAIDIVLSDPRTGIEIPNLKSSVGFPVYESFAREMRAAQMEIAPQMANDFRWGGWFGSSNLNKGGVDLMHFDFTTGAPMAGGHWDIGTKPEHFAKVMAMGPGEIYNDRGQFNAKPVEYYANLTPPAMTAQAQPNLPQGRPQMAFEGMMPSPQPSVADQIAMGAATMRGPPQSSTPLPGALSPGALSPAQVAAQNANAAQIAAEPRARMSTAPHRAMPSTQRPISGVSSPTITALDATQFATAMARGMPQSSVPGGLSPSAMSPAQVAAQNAAQARIAAEPRARMSTAPHRAVPSAQRPISGVSSPTITALDRAQIEAAIARGAPAPTNMGNSPAAPSTGRATMNVAQADAMRAGPPSPASMHNPAANPQGRPSAAAMHNPAANPVGRASAVPGIPQGRPAVSAAELHNPAANPMGRASAVPGIPQGRPQQASLPGGLSPSGVQNVAFAPSSIDQRIAQAFDAVQQASPAPSPAMSPAMAARAASGLQGFTAPQTAPASALGPVPGTLGPRINAAPPQAPMGPYKANVPAQSIPTVQNPSPSIPTVQAPPAFGPQTTVQSKPVGNVPMASAIPGAMAPATGMPMNLLAQHQGLAAPYSGMDLAKLAAAGLMGGIPGLMMGLGPRAVNSMRNVMAGGGFGGGGAANQATRIGAGLYAGVPLGGGSRIDLSNVGSKMSNAERNAMLDAGRRSREGSGLGGVSESAREATRGRSGLF